MRYSLLRLAGMLCLSVSSVQGQSNESTFLEGQIETSPQGVTLTSNSDHAPVKIANPEILRGERSHRVVLHGTLTKDGFRVISAATIEDPNKPYDSALAQSIAEVKDAAMVGHLLQLGADPNSKTSEGVPILTQAMHMADRGLMDKHMADLFLMGKAGDRNVEIITLLLDHGADANALTAWWQTPLMAAAFAGDERLVKILLDHKANVNIGSKVGMTALMYAQGTPVTKLLLAAGASVNDKEITGRTALHFATMRADPDAVSALIQAGANVNALDDKGISALHIANLQMQSGDYKAKVPLAVYKDRVQSVVHLLLAAGSRPDSP